MQPSGLLASALKRTDQNLAVRLVQDAAYERIRATLQETGQTEAVALLDRWVMLNLVGKRSKLRVTLLIEMSRILARFEFAPSRIAPPDLPTPLEKTSNMC